MAQRKPFLTAIWKMTLTITLIKDSILLFFIILFRDTKSHSASVLYLLSFPSFALVLSMHADLEEKDQNKVRLLWKRNRILFTSGAR